jgi:hypothetical protein
VDRHTRRHAANEDFSGRLPLARIDTNYRGQKCDATDWGAQG